MLNKICSMKFRNILLISDDTFLCAGVGFLPALNRRVECLNLESFIGSEVNEADIVLLDLLSWQTCTFSVKTSMTEIINNHARMIMITCGVFQELLTDILYPNTLKVNRKDIVHLLNKLCGLQFSYRFEPTPKRKVRKFLTKREFDVLHEFITGSGSGIISNKFNINCKTVSSHKLSALGKIGCKNMAHFYILSRPFTCDLGLLFKKNDKLSA
ncbi:hypothetical protein WB66_14515 [bacteria symbiont BFo1 of Frankliniella occidentalis]|uniref:LuxR C-terminal-related transcriptional regulator n=1 Tax=Erwinia aphidicola TaxID=68334 RepID=A0ABU8DAD9_ERWAP|nr:LuxR C-terminal-related transcriptional regulator [Erwinia aphidicola]KYP83822.1 hypothetical protein WB66_14515 [bacteria symbiont BFo1 of Frankliniella occidentalis]PIJ55193.1 hypothetical protein BOM23_20250 [Erwinia sp. OLMDLW33]KYP89200.1 hypothetical protein WB91_13360 [bacteria symbiont BFo1 of Frankliniella occidentalis]MBD1376563.1 hypothetical protein [Erwinia aphidicola]CAH0193179.1 hypothetical protein SRABI13_01543 [Erwinia aphidicola]